MNGIFKDLNPFTYRSYYLDRESIFCYLIRMQDNINKYKLEVKRIALIDYAFFNES